MGLVEALVRQDSAWLSMPSRAGEPRPSPAIYREPSAGIAVLLIFEQMGLWNLQVPEMVRCVLPVCDSQAGQPCHLPGEKDGVGGVHRAQGVPIGIPIGLLLERGPIPKAQGILRLAMSSRMRLGLPCGMYHPTFSLDALNGPGPDGWHR